jgi:hypothetical protein
VIHSPSKRYATRRAILVIPHVTHPDTDLSPLGLVSVRIGPKFHGDVTKVNFSFTWRTVEALVGFPYSIYGSVQFANFISEKIKISLPNDIARKTSMGTVTYIAHSLHLFDDIYTQNIARRIVDDSSK